MFKMKTNQTSYVTKLLYWKGPETFEYTSIFIELIKNCETFFDVGANTGYYSLMAAKANKKIKIHGFEPSSGPLHYLNENVSLNGFEDQVTIHPIALSSSKGTATFYEVANRKYSYLKHNLGGVGSLKQDRLKNSFAVKTETLDQFVAIHNINNIDLIKIDTEGTEHMILLGATNVISEARPIIICETLFNKIEAELEAIMKTHGYLFFNHESGKLSQVKTLIRHTDNGVRDCFFVHPTKLYMIKRFIA